VSRNYSRRTFLKLSGAAAAALAATPALPGMLSTWAGEKKLEGAVEFTPSFCEMCTSRCPIQAKVVDGKTVLINGNPNFAATGGTVCARGGSGFSQMYDPQRVTKPLIRAGERGEGKWREVTYEEAYAYIAEKMAAIKTKYGPEAMAFACRTGTHMAYLFNLAQAYGSPNIFTHESTCPQARQVAYEATFGTTGVGIDYGNVKYLLSLGRNYFEGLHVAQARGVMNAISKGAKLVYVDPRFSLTAAKANEWHAIKPGTDFALVQAINHVLIRDGLYDRDFVAKYTEGFEAVKAAVAECTPAWAEAETGVKAADIERIARELAAARPRAVVDPGWRTTYTPDEFGFRRAIVIANVLLGNMEVPGGMFFVKNAGFLNGMVGKEIVPGLKAGKLPPYPKPGKPRVDGAGVKGHPNFLVPRPHGAVQTVPEAILTGNPYHIKGWFVYRYNPALTLPNTPRVVEALKKLDLLVVNDIYLTDTAWFADVVLPESTYLERDEGFMDASGLVPVYSLRQQVVKPVFETRTHWQIMKELGEKMGLGEYFPWKDIEAIRLTQMGGRADLVKMGKEKGLVTFGMKPLYLRDRNSVAEFVKQFPDAQSLVNEAGIIDKPLTNLKTGTKKIELLSSSAQEAFGLGVPVYKKVVLATGDQYNFVQGKTAIHTNGHTHNVPWLYGLMPTNRLWMHPQTAAKLGLADGAEAEMKSAAGKQRAKVLVTEGVRPDTVFCYFGFGRISPGLKRAYNKGVNAGMVLPTVTAPVCGATLLNTGVTITKV
jgi:thiosulfate reductase/polysulfide reductase chain A